ncbi:hypothetical protein CBS147332_9464 [Penicillium roqueforti]|nr:hypothetical protein CBS147332_9464 [Penicillium roqueforti]KAI3103778.1 hypothetical protein CBS147331_7382 [Penicillium roqueforti]
MVLIQHFPEAAAISFIFNTIIVEFDEVDEDAWRERESGPYRFPSRISPPKPADLNTLVSDDSDYIAATGFFNPGAMICSDQEDAVSAGVLVEKSSEQGLTVACHCWDREFDERLDHLGDPNHFRVLQANSRVGCVTERIDETDIGLAKLDDTVAFSNRFLDIETAAKVLIPFTGVKTGDKFFIDSFVTGRQRLLCAGVRVLGCIYATNDTMITTVPQLRAGICGSVLVRLQRAGEESICLEDGETRTDGHAFPSQRTPVPLPSSINHDSLSSDYKITVSFAAFIDLYYSLLFQDLVRDHGQLPGEHASDGRPTTLPLTQKIIIGMSLFVHLNAFYFAIRLFFALLKTPRESKKALQRRHSTTPKSVDTEDAFEAELAGNVSLSVLGGTQFEAESKYLVNNQEVVHAIILPNYKENFDTLWTTLYVLASHPRAASQYEVSSVLVVHFFMKELY